jgi:hypothetical protein
MRAPSTAGNSCKRIRQHQMRIRVTSRHARFSSGNRGAADIGELLMIKLLHNPVDRASDSVEPKDTTSRATTMMQQVA